MASKQTDSKKDNQNRIVQEARQSKAQREKNYRERALKLFPWICGRCAREFSGKKLKELTVHHKDHNHDNNPPDGSNWELLCIYCHDNEHSRDQVADWYAGNTPDTDAPSQGLNTPFADLEKLLKKK